MVYYDGIMDELRSSEAAATAVVALDPEVVRASQLFLRRIADRYKPTRALLFGSRARGEHHSESDADLAVVLDGVPGDRWSAAREMARLAFDVLMETGILIDPLPLWEIELEHPDRFTNPALARAILVDGRPICPRPLPLSRSWQRPSAH